MKIQIIVGSTRPERATPRVASWVHNTATALLPEVTWEMVDLAEYPMPLFDEPLPPLGNKNRHPAPEVQKWLDTLARADGYVMVTPEYNHSMPAVLKNAIDYVDKQLTRKPVTIVSHGVAGGVRSSEQLAQALRSNIGAIPISDAVALNGMVGANNLISENGELLSETVQGAQKPLEKALESLVWYIKQLREEK